MRKNLAPLLLWCAAIASATALVVAGADIPSSLGAASAKSKGIQAFTKPSDDRTLSFERPGRVAKVFVDLNSEVKAGDMLAQQNDIEEQNQLNMDTHKAVKTDPIAAVAEEKVHEKDKQKYQDMLDSKAAARTELLEQKSTVEVDEARMEMSKDQIETDNLKTEATRAIVEERKLKVPDDCKGTYIVAQPANPNQSLMKAGEIADASQTKVVRIVKIDPMFVDVSVPRLDAEKLKPGDTAQVTITGNKVLPGAVSQVLAIGDPASGTIPVRVEVPNPNRIKPGDSVFVNFPGTTDVAAQP